MFKKILTFVIAAYLPTAAILLIGCEGEDSYTPRITGIVPELHENSSNYGTYRSPSTSSYSSSSSSSPNGLE